MSTSKNSNKLFVDIHYFLKYFNNIRENCAVNINFIYQASIVEDKILQMFLRSFSLLFMILIKLIYKLVWVLWKHVENCQSTSWPVDCLEVVQNE